MSKAMSTMSKLVRGLAIVVIVSAVVSCQGAYFYTHGVSLSQKGQYSTQSFFRSLQTFIIHIQFLERSSAAANVIGTRTMKIKNLFIVRAFIACLPIFTGVFLTFLFVSLVSPAVLYSFCDYLSFEKNTALRIACGFGAGMGRKEEISGAVSYGILVIGRKYAAQKLYYTSYLKFTH